MHGIEAVLSGQTRYAVICARVEEVEPLLPDGCASLMPVDGPYHGVKAHGWDNEHDDKEAFLGWKRERYQAWKRILAPNGTLYDFASPRMAWHVERLVREEFSLSARITWAKVVKHTPANYKMRKESLRTFFPLSETIFMAERPGPGDLPLSEFVYVNACDDERGRVFEPLRAYLEGERSRAGLDRKTCNVVCGNRMSGHYFSAVQGALPTEQNYERLRAAAPGFFKRPWVDLKQEHDALLETFKARRDTLSHIRRPFHASSDVPFTDVWHYPTVQPYDGKHPCEKPADMARDIVRISSRPNDLVLVFFSGSGVFAAEALRQGRQVIAVEMDPHWADVTRAACEAAAGAPPSPRIEAPTPTPRPGQLSLF